jgi:hypothetical protein
MLYLAFTLLSLAVLEPSFRGTHVRGVTPRMRDLVVTGANRSATFRGLLARLERSDVVAYVYEEAAPGRALDGWLTFQSAAGGYRYVQIRIALRSRASRNIATLGHELQHAVEIAERPWIVDAPTMAAAYASLGHAAVSVRSTRAFDTVAAVRIGQRIGREAARQ